METYRVRGRRRVDAIVAAIEASGGTVIHAADAARAPFEFDIRFPEGRVHRLICYAFTANKYRQGGRPTDEHRLQVKYGSDFKRLHELHVVADKQSTTLFFGVHDDLDLFIAADPALHNPTWFSSSLEFKDADLAAAQQVGWHAWQRDRVAGGRRRANARESLVNETLHAFTPAYFLSYVRFERVAMGMDPSERLILCQDVGADLTSGRPARALVERQLAAPDLPQHELLERFGLSIDELLDVIDKAPRLRTAVRGGVAERHLFALLKRTAGLTHVKKIDLDGEPDFSLVFKRRPVRVECKLVAPALTRDLPRVDFQKTRTSKGDRCSRYYSASQFEVLAACLHPITSVWEYRYALTSTLPPHKTCTHKISDRILVEPTWSDDLTALLT